MNLFFNRWESDIKSLIGKTIIDIRYDIDKLGFTTSCGLFYKFFHDQDCSETVKIEDVIGDLEDLIGSPITMAEAVVGETPNDWQIPDWADSFTWTFYKFATVKGYVTVRWFGESNGYYSESVDLEVYQIGGRDV